MPPYTAFEIPLDREPHALVDPLHNCGRWTGPVASEYKTFCLAQREFAILPTDQASSATLTCYYHYPGKVTVQHVLYPSSLRQKQAATLIIHNDKRFSSGRLRRRFFQAIWILISLHVVPAVDQKCYRGQINSADMRCVNYYVYTTRGQHVGRRSKKRAGRMC